MSQLPSHMKENTHTEKGTPVSDGTHKPEDAGEASQQPPLMFTQPRDLNSDRKADSTMPTEVRSTEEVNLEEIKACLDVLLAIANYEKHTLSCMTSDQDTTKPDIIREQEQTVEETTKLAGLVQKRYDLTVTIDGINAKIVELYPSILAEIEKMNIRYAAGKPPTEAEESEMKKTLAVSQVLGPQRQKLWEAIRECDDEIAKAEPSK